MKICVSAVSGNLDAQIDPRFGRCQYFVIVNSETMEFEAVPNLSASAMGGAGIQAAQTVANKGVKVVITGNIGPNAYQVLSSAGIELITSASGTVREAVERFKKGQLTATGGPTAPMGFRMGSGMGRGRGQLTSPYPTQPPTGISPIAARSASKEQEMQMFENRIKNLQQQLEQVKKRIELEKE